MRTFSCRHSSDILKRQLCESVIIEIELKRARWSKAVMRQIFNNVFVKVQIAHFRAAVLMQSNLGSFKLNWIHAYNDGKVIKFFFEIQMYDIAVFTHSVVI